MSSVKSWSIGPTIVVHVSRDHGFVGRGCHRRPEDDVICAAWKSTCKSRRAGWIATQRNPATWCYMIVPVGGTMFAICTPLQTVAERTQTLLLTSSQASPVSSAVARRAQTGLYSTDCVRSDFDAPPLQPPVIPTIHTIPTSGRRRQIMIRSTDCRMLILVCAGVWTLQLLLSCVSPSERRRCALPHARCTRRLRHERMTVQQPSGTVRCS